VAQRRTAAPASSDFGPSVRSFIYLVNGRPNGIRQNRGMSRWGRKDGRGLWTLSSLAAGNAADPRAQVITSAGAGSAAAIAMNANLVQEDVERAVSDFAGAPFSSDMESHVSELVLGDRRHGL
jgi:hypothetical protein